LKEEVAQKEHGQYCEPWEKWSDSQLQDENGEWRGGWSQQDFQPPDSQSTKYYEREDEKVEAEGEAKVEETEEGRDEQKVEKTQEASEQQVEETQEASEHKAEETQAGEDKAAETEEGREERVQETQEESEQQVEETQAGEDKAEDTEEGREENVQETQQESEQQVEETQEGGATQTAEPPKDAEVEVEQDIAEEPEKQQTDPSYVDPHADLGARSWPGRVTIHDPRGLRWQFWGNQWWLGFPPRSEEDEVDLWTDPAAWSVHSEMASTAVPSWVGSDGDVAAMEAERENAFEGKHPYIKDEILKKKQQHKEARQARKEREEQEAKHEAGEVLWTPLTKHGFNDFILACNGGCPQVEHPSSTLSIHATSTVPKKTEPKVRWRPCTSQGVVAFQNMFAQAASAHADPLNMNLEELIQYSHDLKDYSQIPDSTPEFVIETIKYIVYLYDEWGIAHANKVDEWLRLRLGYFCSEGEVGRNFETCLPVSNFKRL